MGSSLPIRSSSQIHSFPFFSAFHSVCLVCGLETDANISQESGGSHEKTLAFARRVGGLQSTANIFYRLSSSKPDQCHKHEINLIAFPHGRLCLVICFLDIDSKGISSGKKRLKQYPLNRKYMWLIASMPIVIIEFRTSA